MIRSLDDILDMAQVLAVPGDVRHGFSYNCTFNHNFARITGLAASSNGNIVLCDHNNKTLILVDNIGNYITKLNVDSEPFDVAIASQNVGYITQPNTRSVLQIDPERMVVLSKHTCNDLGTTMTSTVKGSCSLVVNKMGYSSIYEYSNISNLTNVPGTQSSFGSSVVKFHALDESSFFTCNGGQNYITYIHKQGTCKTINMATLDTPSDICIDDFKHIYVSGQGSNSIHRLKRDGCVVYDMFRKPAPAKDWKVIDIPLNSQHGIKEPVAVCFNQNYSRFYVVNEWGKSVLVFDVL